MRRVRGVTFGFADEFVMKVTRPAERFRRWVKVDLRWRNLIAHRWESRAGDYIEISRDGRAQFKLGPYQGQAKVDFGTEEAIEEPNVLDHAVGFWMHFYQDDVHCYLELNPTRNSSGIMTGESINVTITRNVVTDGTKKKTLLIYEADLKKPNKP